MAAPRKIVLASRNQDKLRELREVCAAAGIGAGGEYDSPFEIVPSTDYPGLPEVVEDGTTVRGNAERKAIVTAAYTGEIAIGDDTAFQVLALNNLPDIFASRFAGPGATYADNAELVLELMRGVPAGLRQARFVTSAVWVDPTPEASGLAAKPELPPAIRSRWLHNPFARAIHVKDTAQEDAFWSGFADRRSVWREYRTRWGAVQVALGADRNRLLEALDRLVEPMLEGGRPLDAPPAAIRLPDTRIWTSQGRGSEDQPPTLVTPSGLPADAPGLAVNQPLWLELSSAGRLLGEIGREPVGFGGFGYDPIFLPEGLDRSLAELEPEEKNAISHRGRALRRLLDAARVAYGLGR
jgi:inosine/xanthosine triphosphate pyrophosphatase family protein